MARRKKLDELLWADEVMEVYRNLGTLPGSRDWSSPSASHLFDWAMRDENETKFLTTMVPKATDIKAKFGLEDVTEEIVKIDTKIIADLKKCLATAVAESQEDRKPEPEPKSEPEPTSGVGDLSLDDLF